MFWVHKITSKQQLATSKTGLCKNQTALTHPLNVENIKTAQSMKFTVNINKQKDHTKRVLAVALVTYQESNVLGYLLGYSWVYSSIESQHNILVLNQKVIAIIIIATNNNEIVKVASYRLDL